MAADTPEQMEWNVHWLNHIEDLPGKYRAELQALYSLRRQILDIAVVAEHPDIKILVDHLLSENTVLVDFFELVGGWNNIAKQICIVS